MEKDIYLFLDWSMTTNELIKDGKIHTEKFKAFVETLSMFKGSFKSNLKFIVVSGTDGITAEKYFKLLKAAFLKAGNIELFGGFSYEYGGFLIDENGKTIQLETQNISIKKQNIIKQIMKEFNIQNNNAFKLYFNFEFDKIDDKAKLFIKKCKESCSDLDFDVYDDKYGHGFDIKNQLLNKGNFINNYVTKNNLTASSSLIIVGGDSLQDLKMLSALPNAFEKYFIGFKNFVKEEGENIILSEKENIEGIIDCLYKLHKKLI